MPLSNAAAVSSFVAQVRAFQRKTDIEIEKTLKKIAFDLYRRIILKTPVDTGRARASWNISVGKPDLSVASEGSHPAPRITGNELDSIRSSFGARFSTIYITNNLSYVVFLEHGSSKQAPNGMVAISIQELKNSLVL